MPKSSIPVIMLTEEQEGFVNYTYRCFTGSQQRAVAASRTAKRPSDAQVAQRMEVCCTTARDWRKCRPEATGKPLVTWSQVTRKDSLAAAEYTLVSFVCRILKRSSFYLVQIIRRILNFTVYFNATLTQRRLSFPGEAIQGVPLQAKCEKLLESRDRRAR